MARVFLGLGSNIDAEENIRSAIETLRELYSDLVVSTVYESEAVGFQGDNFLNLVVAFTAEESVDVISELMDEIEDAHGRRRNHDRMMARTLDIDMLLYDDLVDESMNIPRNEIETYAFVLLPLSELAPDMRHPVSGDTFIDMWERFDKGDQNLWAADLDF
ncbi:2-amino-4-hydroxy-6-hydroxymethyldihydropteridine diphosphokinase [Sulfuriflexus sp.]|uniref:2-amino-4-hydroxy-6- hydroxymethyldihydropteridine diphosphokinase n=1 Tax=Sulfuriflexus sp. TaxID=2015443 RepID=UPI0028CEFB78|nr:2-amino-4-hydroxy-6-hydroxymethyldihydropteridine diphosphokinase [Sulfuriflexus sp.]MDT8405037.1 2-amino-4-hydroxy-6-hydroxymethyldihydropteridine diphosphokinase [Sulfuriflexus sp.]